MGRAYAPGVTRTLILVRHAKSARPDDVPDHDRPLAGRGRRDAPALGRWLAEHRLIPQLVLVSSARRAVETAELIAAELVRAPTQVRSDGAYNASAAELLDLVHELPDDVDSAMVVGHNPSIEELARQLAGDGADLGEMPTCAVVVFQVDGDWGSAGPGIARLTASAAPRG
ncbi:MAG: histidine phosphatase family protein [Jiangellaceae bacterium]|nr:histidine phosphatase family protein [Jiangellaceae bacterium]